MDIAPLVQKGLKPVIIPNPVVYYLKQGGAISEKRGEDHIDRFGALLRDPDGALHFLIPNEYASVLKITQVSKTKETMKRLRWILEKAEIELEIVKGLSVPSALNFKQLQNGKVIITGGDDALFDAVADIVGDDEVFPTEIPIFLLPVVSKGAIRCMTMDAPEGLFRRI